jgi:hypothetical protein
MRSGDEPITHFMLFTLALVTHSTLVTHITDASTTRKPSLY